MTLPDIPPAHLAAIASLKNLSEMPPDLCISAADREDLQRAANLLEQLATWKRDMLYIESTWDNQAVGKALGVTLGQDIRPAILPGIERLKAKAETRRKALQELLARYVGLVNCGDCGFWDPETEKEVKAARRALQ